MVKRQQNAEQNNIINKQIKGAEAGNEDLISRLWPGKVDKRHSCMLRLMCCASKLAALLAYLASTARNCEAKLAMCCDDSSGRQHTDDHKTHPMQVKILTMLKVQGSAVLTLRFAENSFSVRQGGLGVEDVSKAGVGKLTS